MPYPAPPTQSTSYTAFEQSQGDGSFPGQEIDVDLGALARAINELLDFLRVSLRADGKLQNASVRRETLGPDVTVGFNAPASWKASVDYVVSDTVFVDGKFYLCEIAHTAGTDFDVDLAAGRWALLMDLAPVGSLLASSNLSDLVDVAAARTNLGLGALATMGTAPIANGGTGGVTPADARRNLGLGDAAIADIGTGVQAYSTQLAAIAALSTQPFGRSLLTQIDATAARSLLGLKGLASATNAFVTFNGTNGAILSAGNVSSVTRNSVGDYKINFTSSVNGTFAAMVETLGEGRSEYYARTASSVSVRTRNGSGALTDFTDVSVIVVGT